MSAEESITAQSRSSPTAEAPAEASLELCIHLMWCQQQQCWQAASEDLSPPATSLKQLSGLRLVPVLLLTCLEREEQRWALVIHDLDRTVPLPISAGLLQALLQALCLSSLLTPPGGAEIGHPQWKAKASSTSFGLWSKSLFSSQTRGVVILISTAIFAWLLFCFVLVGWFWCVCVWEWLLAAAASAVTQLWLCGRAFPSCSWSGPARSSWAVSPKPPLPHPAAAWALGCFPVPAAGPWGCSAGHLNCTHSTGCALLITIQSPRIVPFGLKNVNKTKRWQIKPNVNKCKLSGRIWMI